MANTEARARARRSSQVRPGAVLPGWPGRRLLLGVLLTGTLALAACGSVASGLTAGARPAAATGRSPAGPSGTAQDSTKGAPAGRPGSAGLDKGVPGDLLLCRESAAATAVVIARSPTVRQIQPAHVVPSARTTVRVAAKVRALARALCALPPMPRGLLSCPLILEGHYTLWFTAAGRILPVVTIQPSGCEIVTGLGPARTVRESPWFWPILASAMKAGVPVPPLPVFIPEPQDGTCAPASRSGTGGVGQC